MLAIGCLVASAFFLALGSIFTKVLVQGHSSLSFAILQLSGGVVLLWMVVLVSKFRFGLRRLIVKTAFLGVFLGAGALLGVLALSRTTASEAALVFATQPLVILLLSWMMAGESMKSTVVALGLVAFIGVVMAISPNLTEDARGSVSGSMFALFSTISASIYLVKMRGVVLNEHPVVALVVVQSAALILLSIAALSLGDSPFVGGREASMDMNKWVPIVLSGMLYYGIAFLVYLFGLQKIPSSQAGLYLNLVPIFTIFLAYFWLLETFSAIQWLGATLILTSIFFISRIAMRGE